MEAKVWIASNLVILQFKLLKARMELIRYIFSIAVLQGIVGFILSTKFLSMLLVCLLRKIKKHKQPEW